MTVPILVGITIALFVITLISRSIIVVRQAEVVIVERLGKYFKTLPSGIHIIVPIFDKIRPIHWRYNKADYRGNVIVTQRQENRIDLRETVYDFPRQNVITSDNVSININALLYFQVTDPYKAVYEIGNLPEAIEKLTQTSLRNVIGELTLDFTLTSRDTINAKLRDILDEATDKWGVKVNRVELQEILPPEEIRTAMEKEMRAERDKRAKILQADGEREFQIRVAEGDKTAKITRAEGEAQAKLLVAEAERKSIELIASSVKDSKTDPAQYLIALKYVAAFSEVTKQGDKTVVIPYESSALLGSVKTLANIFEK
ncbi:MAG: SPFH/Band 7/PHB domain protein [Candidatus Cloacimonetes bacterium]|jgi:regulator of protease activity HflC (stomatin/prohibitin superfamily)|nr:SPFH/Band 7/PHB domain protein [Candidatus Cloacimonadota bacterium]MDD3143286.1 SPFH/Band 7/PHB domain protein [Candidatus Cloacimonadota bacterium]MDY0367142.1 SPFH domain-containing protein [Candidatus Syntrophosphaera sp.]HOY84947.1 SPFH domain-containing protein [Candidatus Syntrophosphaera sp.]HPH60854.1 SPFH domain-containing protein [Candidatus Syntrophosphaera sp.]